MNRRRGVARGPLLVGLAVLLIATLVGLTVLWKNKTAASVDIPVPASLDTFPAALQTSLRKHVALVREEPKSHEQWGALGIAYDVHEMPSEAGQCYAKAAELNSSEFRWPYFLGHLYMTSDAAQSLTSFKQAVLLRPDYAPGHISLATAYANSGDYEQAALSYNEALSIDDSYIHARLGLATAALANDDVAKALELLHDAAARGPREDQIHMLFAEAYRRSGDQSLAELHQRRAGTWAKPEPYDDPIRNEARWSVGVTEQWHRKRALAYETRDDVGSAIREWQALLDSDADAMVAYGEIAMIHLRAGQPDEAQRVLDQGLRRDNADPGCRNLKGWIFATNGNVVQGIDLLLASCADEPDNEQFRLRLARGYWRTGRAALAIPEYERYRLRRPGDHQVHLEYARALGEAKRFDDSIAAFEELADLAPELVTVFLYGARTSHTAARYRDAVSFLERGHAAFPKDAQVRNDLAWLLATTPDETVANGARSVELIMPLCRQTKFEHPHALNTLAAAHARAKNFGEASRIQKAAISIVSRGNDSQSIKLAEDFRTRLSLYQRQRPYIEHPAQH